MTEVTDPFWLDEPSILWNTDRLVEFFVSSDQSNIEKLNSIMRFSIYVSIILSLYHSRPEYILIALLGAFLTFFLKRGIPEKTKESFGEKQEYTRATINNPFGNSSIADISDNPERPPMVDYVTKNEDAMKAKQEVEDSFEYNLYRDVGDVWNKKHSQRQFYTMPDRGTIPNDAQGDFKQWLYGDMKSLKENNYNGSRRLHEPLQYYK